MCIFKRPTSLEPVFLPPLFERLTLRGTYFLDEEGVKASISEELSRLLNTRLSHEKIENEAGIEEEESAGISSYLLPDFFGLQDFSAVSMEDSSTWDALEKQMQRACAAYEPRLRNPQIRIVRDNIAFQKLTLSISGEVVLGEKTIQITFPLALELPAKDRTYYPGL